MTVAARIIPSTVVADHFGAQIADRRPTEDPRSVLRELARSFSIDLPADAVSTWTVQADGTATSERQIAARSARLLLAAHFGESIEICGPWLPGEPYRLGTELFILTGGACPECGGPEAYGGGGVFCPARACMWRFCA